ncbi:Major facilitator superfamily domain,Major facilitator, sugar transporter-like [Cinara cedri]|uniref:Major facilitator superfamily domain,Major facilitator, sugar transporter-like n=1 Tax=Cinara cedri TaxID=506608 RepID=A0A5E4NHX3_9HEMI|nr:Major facilitator superfamily domain,Major facilitator, sugar transporter-like [Cinara cedri]
MASRYVSARRLIMAKYVFLFFNWFGAFPVVYDQETKIFAICRRGLLVTFVQVVFVGLEIHKHLIMLFFGAIKKTTAVSAIVLATNGFGLLIVLLRRIAFVRDTVACYNSLQSEWPANISVRKSSKLILYASAAMVFIDFVGDNIERRTEDKPMSLGELTALASLGFEMQLIHTFHTIGQLYGDLNEYVESNLSDDLERIHKARQKNLVLYTFCKKFNSHYNVDLIIHFSCYQLNVLLELFEFVKMLSTSIGTNTFFYSFMDLKTIIKLIRMTRIFLVFIYLIESSTYLHHKSVFTFYCILRSRVNYLKYQTKEQLYLFLDELNATEVTITANYCYDVDKKFLCSVSGSIIAVYNRHIRTRFSPPPHSVSNSNSGRPYDEAGYCAATAEINRGRDDNDACVEGIPEKKPRKQKRIISADVELIIMTYDDLLHKIGDFGTYQRRIYFFLCLPGISCALHKLAGVFILAKANHRCQLPGELANASYVLPPNIMNMSYPFDDKTESWSSCRMYDTNFTDAYYSHKIPANHSRTCDRWIFDKSDFQNTAVMEFNLVCDKAWYKGTSDSMLMVGVMLGAIIFGYLSDRIGRKNIFTISVWLQGIAGCGLAFTQEYWSFTFLRVIVGASTSGLYLAAYVIGLEFVSPSYRMVVGVVIQMFFSVGFLLTSAFAYAFNNWRYFQLAITVPTLCYTTYQWFIPESVRWLLTNGKQEKAVEILQKVCRVNDVEMSKKDIIDVLERNSVDQPVAQNYNLPKASFFDLFKHPVILKRSIVIMLLWFVNSTAYYGLSWSTTSLGGNQFLVFNLAGLVEFPAYTFLLLTLNRWGRKINISGFLILAGLALLATLVIPKTCTWLTIFCAMIAKLAITASYGAVYVYTAEQFPTVVRNMGLGVGSFFAKIGGIAAPHINNMSEISTSMPLIVYGSLALLVGVWSLVLPETLNKKLPDTIEDLIAMSEKNYQTVLLKEPILNNKANKIDNEKY